MIRKSLVKLEKLFSHQPYIKIIILLIFEDASLKMHQILYHKQVIYRRYKFAKCLLID